MSFYWLKLIIIVSCLGLWACASTNSQTEQFVQPNGTHKTGTFKGLERIQNEAKRPAGKNINGWVVISENGNYRADYVKRAGAALRGVEVGLDVDAISPQTAVDADGEPLSGLRNYVLHFPKGQMPPVKGFWSISMYNSEQLFVQNPLKRFAIGNRDKLKLNKDGSLDIYIQASSPGEQWESNWLPAPREEFNLVMRLYWPRPAALNGRWKIPGVQKSMKANNLAGQFAQEAL